MKEKLFDRADRLKELVNSVRPLKGKALEELKEYFRIGLTYSSNALEGNTLDITETKLLLEDGITAGGKPMKDHLEAIGHSEAYDYMLQMAGDGFVVTEEVIRTLHKMFYYRIDTKEAGQYRDHDVYITGTSYIPPVQKDVSDLMTKQAYPEP